MTYQVILVRHCGIGCSIPCRAVKGPPDTQWRRTGGSTYRATTNWQIAAWLKAIEKSPHQEGRQSSYCGRYRRQDAEKPKLVLVGGDVAPYWLNLGPHGELVHHDAVVWEVAAELQRTLFGP